MGIPDHLTCLLRNLYAGQEAMVRTGHGTYCLKLVVLLSDSIPRQPTKWVLFSCFREKTGSEVTMLNAVKLHIR